VQVNKTPSTWCKWNCWCKWRWMCGTTSWWINCCWCWNRKICSVVYVNFQMNSTKMNW